MVAKHALSLSSGMGGGGVEVAMRICGQVRGKESSEFRWLDRQD